MSNKGGYALNHKQGSQTEGFQKVRDVSKVAFLKVSLFWMVLIDYKGRSSNARTAGATAQIHCQFIKT